MGLFDNLAKTITTPQEKANYVTLEATAEAAIAALKNAPGVSEIKNYLEVEDLRSKNIIMRVATKSSNLNIRKGPGTQFDIIGKAAHNSHVQLIKKMYNGWYYIKAADGTEGFCSTDYLAGI